LTYINEAQMKTSNPKHTKKHQIQKVASKNTLRNDFFAYIYQIQKPVAQNTPRNDFFTSIQKPSTQNTLRNDF